MSQVPEDSYTLAAFRNTFRKRFEFTNLTVLGADADGTHFYYDDSRGERHFGVITDLTSPNHRHTPTSFPNNTANLTKTAGAGFSTVNTVNFTPEVIPVNMALFWSSYLNPNDADLDGFVTFDIRVRRTAPTALTLYSLAGISITTGFASNAWTMATRLLSDRTIAAGDANVLRTYVTEAQVQDPTALGIDTLDFIDSQFRMIPIYERRVNV